MVVVVVEDVPCLCCCISVVTERLGAQMWSWRLVVLVLVLCVFASGSFSSVFRSDVQVQVQDVFVVQVYQNVSVQVMYEEVN